MNRAAALPVLVSVVVGTAACRNPTPLGVARVIQATPSGAEIGAVDLQDGIRVTFDRAVGPPDRLRYPITGPALVMDPAVDGESRWLDARTLAFFPKGKLEPSRAYSVRLARGLVTAPGVGVESWKGLRIVYDRIQVEDVTFLAGTGQYQTATPVLVLRTSHPVVTSAAVQACAFYERRSDGGTGARTPSAAARDDASGGKNGDDSRDPNESARSVRLKPARPLPLGTPYLFRCSVELRSPRGTEGLAQAYEVGFSTYGSAGVTKVMPAGHDISADSVHVKIVFATPMNPSDVRKLVELAPVSGKPVAMDLAADAVRTEFAWAGDLEPGSDYRIVFKPGLKDSFGQKVSAEPHAFHVGDATPRLSMDAGIFTVERGTRYPIFTRNLPEFHVGCAAVPERRVAAVLTGPGNYDAWWDASEQGPIDYTELGLRLHEKVIEPRGKKNRWVDSGLDLAATCGGGKVGGLYILELRTNGEVTRDGQIRTHDRRSLANVTDLGVLAKVGNASSLVWVVRLSTGKPVAGAVVKIRDLGGKVRFSGATNADGVALAPGATKLVGLKPHGGSTGSAPAGEDEDASEWEDYRARRVIVTAQEADDLAVLDTNWNNGVQIWNFGLPQDRQGGTVRVRGFLQSDRGLYRPGDTVHLKGLVRVVDVSGKMALPKQRRIHVVIEDPRGAMLLEQDLPVSPFGGFHRDLELDADARLGDYRVRGEIEGQKFSERFSVEEYRPRTFEVKVKAPARNLFGAGKLRFDVTASYLYGAALRDGKMTWSVRRRQHLPIFPEFAEYSFQDFGVQNDNGRWWARDEERSFSEPVADGETTLGRSGQAKIVVPPDEAAKSAPGPQDYLFEATVEDSSGQAVTTGAVLTAHRADLYLGLHPAEFVQAVDMPFAVQLVGFDAEGKRRAAEAELTLTRRTYDCGVHAGESWPSCRRDETKAPGIRRTVAVPASGSAAVERVVLKEPGEYLVRATAPDGRGGHAISSEIIYVIGKGEAFWSGDEGDRMTVIASKQRFRPGEVARLVPQAQLPGALALLTLERDGILSYKLKLLESTGDALDVPVEPRLAPNVYASVVLARGRTGQGDKGRPRFKMGMVKLEVDAAEKRLALAIETDRPSYQPGDEVKARVKITGADGAPVRAELALAVADEGVLQIAGYKTPDPMPAFYAAWGLGVETATTWNRVLRARNPDEYQDDEEGGDAGGDEAGRIRSRFVATAFWAPALVTGADGTVEVRFKAPDNLTAFRVMAAAADTGDRFGSGEKRFTVAKPLQAMPAVPRFLTVGDKARAAVIVHNNTKDALSVDVTAAVKGVVVEGKTTRTVAVAAGASQPAVFAVTAAREGEAVFTFKVAGGAEKDAVEVRLPVRRPSLPDTLLVGEGAVTGRAEHALPPLGEVIQGHTSFEVVLDTTGLSRLDEGLAYLVGYPYGCLEQTTSRVVPMVALGELTKSIDLPGVNAAKARTFVEAGVAKMLRHQHEDGGFGLWIGAPAETHYTAVALWGLSIAKAGGFKVNEAALEQGAKYLRARLAAGAAAGGSHSEIVGELGASAFAHYALAAVGRADPGGLARLFDQRAQLPLFGRAFLARALHLAGRDDLAKTVAAELAAGVPGGSGPVLVREGERELDWYWSSDARSTALVLQALLEVTPEQPAVARLADGLLAARAQGRWQSTQENLHALLALSALAKARARAADVAVTVSLDGKTRAHKKLRGAAVERIRLPLGATGGGGPLVIESAGAQPLYYSARIRVERPLGSKAVENGIEVVRAYLDPSTDLPVGKIKVGQTLKVRLTVRAAAQQAHVAVVDRLPAGFEPVITRFRRSYSGEEGGPRRGFWWRATQTAWQNQELRDDRAQVFADVLSAGESQHEYLVRATTAGTFESPPAVAEAMYRPQVNGRSSTGSVVIER
jgi:uncharacterized protein YfaS (alpha-2-macroglobulin family)